MDYTRLSLVEVRNALDDIVRDAEAVFGSLTPSQLNWRPDAARWSVAQCVQHLLTSDDLMLAAAHDVAVPRDHHLQRIGRLLAARRP